MHGSGFQHRSHMLHAKLQLHVAYSIHTHTLCMHICTHASALHCMSTLILVRHLETGSAFIHRQV